MRTAPAVDPRGRAAARILLVLLVAWAVIVPVAPAAASASVAAVRRAADLVYAASAGICHQRGDRSFVTRGRAWPVCARCAGLYLGAAAVIPVGLLGWVSGRMRTSGVRLAVALSATPLVVTWTAERLGLHTFTNGTRALTGVALGAVIGVVLAVVARPVTPKT